MTKTLGVLALVAVCLAALASLASAQAGGSAKNPLHVKRWQGKCIRQFAVSCPTTGDTALVTAAQSAGALSIEFTNNDASNAVVVCPRAAGAAQCDGVGKGKRIPATQSWPADFAVVDRAWSCAGLVGTVQVGVIIEVSGDPDTNDCLAPTPTPLPTYTPTPAPTPTPTP